MHLRIGLCFSLLLIFIFSSCDNNVKRKAATVNENINLSKNFSIQFIQKGKKKRLEHRQVSLKKAPFTIKVDVDNLPGVYVTADFKLDEKYLRDNEFDKLQHIAPKTMAEETFNKNNELIIHDHGYGYWFYNSSLDWHRYNDVEVKDKGGFIGTKKVNRFYVKEQEKFYTVEDAPDDLYLFFFSMEGSFEQGHRVIQREYIKVKWD